MAGPKLHLQELGGPEEGTAIGAEVTALGARAILKVAESASAEKTYGRKDLLAAVRRLLAAKLDARFPPLRNANSEYIVCRQQFDVIATATMIRTFVAIPAVWDEWVADPLTARDVACWRGADVLTTSSTTRPFAASMRKLLLAAKRQADLDEVAPSVPESLRLAPEWEMVRGPIAKVLVAINGKSFDVDIAEVSQDDLLTEEVVYESLARNQALFRALVRDRDPYDTPDVTRDPVRLGRKKWVTVEPKLKEHSSSMAGLCPFTADSGWSEQFLSWTEKAHWCIAAAKIDLRGLKVESELVRAGFTISDASAVTVGDLSWQLSGAVGAVLGPNVWGWTKAEPSLVAPPSFGKVILA